MFVDLRNISKSFGGVRALADVSLSVERGECHALIGENGAGKSTLGKVLAGIHRPDSGQIVIEGQVRVFGSPRDASAAGVGMVHQELAFCPDLSVAENLCMGHYPRRLRFLLDGGAMRQRAISMLWRIGVSLDVDRPMRTLSTAQEQLVQIAAAVGTGARILIFDEPTSSLSQPESQRLFSLIEDLKRQGVTMIYVSHRLPEVLRLCERISVLRDGRHVGTLDRRQASEDALVRMMVGRHVEVHRSAELRPSGGPLLSVRGLYSPGKFQDVSFEVRAGEIVGFAGLVGSGRSEVAAAIFGLDRRARGEVTVAGAALPLGRPGAAMAAGIGLVPEDRKQQGLVLNMSGRANTSLAMLRRLRTMGLLLQRRERSVAQEMYRRLDVRAASVEMPVAALSGGNQQKIVLGKWLARGGRVLIVDEPTRGVDVGAKAAIHAILDGLAQQGAAIMLISSELPELLNLSHRVLVMREGRLVGELSRDQATEESVLRLMAGGGRGG